MTAQIMPFPAERSRDVADALCVMRAVKRIGCDVTFAEAIAGRHASRRMPLTDEMRDMARAIAKQYGITLRPDD